MTTHLGCDGGPAALRPCGCAFLECGARESSPATVKTSTQQETTTKPTREGDISSVVFIRVHCAAYGEGAGPRLHISVGQVKHSMSHY